MTLIVYRSSRPSEVFCKKHLCQSLFFNKVAGLMPATLLKKRPWNRCFPGNFAKFQIIPFLKEHLRWLLLCLDNCFTFASNSKFLFKSNYMKQKSYKFNTTIKRLFSMDFSILSTRHQNTVVRNTRIYNVISVPQITWLFLGDAIISSKTDPHNNSKKEKRSCGKTKNNKSILTILPFIRILYLKQ